MFAIWVLISLSTMTAYVRSSRFHYLPEDSLMRPDPHFRDSLPWLYGIPKSLQNEWDKLRYQVDNQPVEEELETATAAASDALSVVIGPPAAGDALPVPNHHLCNNNVDNLDSNHNNNNNSPPVAEFVAKRTHVHHKAPAEPSSHRSDMCFVSYTMMDLGQHYYPRFLETAQCNHHLPDHLQHVVRCRSIYYPVQVLTRRKDSDPEESLFSKSLLPDALKDSWRFETKTVVAGCHCVAI